MRSKWTVSTSGFRTASASRATTTSRWSRTSPIRRVRIGPDSNGGGVRINMIPRDGGNRFSGDLFVGGSFDGWQKDNLTHELRAAGLRSADALQHLVEVTPAVGGPILRDRVWFFGSTKYSEVKVHPAGARSLSTGADGYTTNDLHNLSGRVTWQVSPAKQGDRVHRPVVQEPGPYHHVHCGRMLFARSGLGHGHFHLPGA